MKSARAFAPPQLNMRIESDPVQVAAPSISDKKTKDLSIQFFDAPKAEDESPSPLRKTKTLRVTQKEWSYIVHGNVKCLIGED